MGEVVSEAVSKAATRVLCTEEQLKEWEEGRLSQEAFPNLSPEEREFVLLGVTEDEVSSETR